MDDSARYCIGIHVAAPDPLAVRQKAVAAMAAHHFGLFSDELVDEAEPDDDSYGLICSGPTRAGWVSLYVTDWQDSGVIAQYLSHALSTAVLEIWVAEDTLWGYNYFECGEVRDRFASDPVGVAESPAEATRLYGDPGVLRGILKTSPDVLESILRHSQANAGGLAAGPVGRASDTLGLNFNHVYTSYEAFFDDDPEDYSPGLENWAQFRHLTFRHPQGKESISG